MSSFLNPARRGGTPAQTPQPVANASANAPRRPSMGRPNLIRAMREGNPRRFTTAPPTGALGLQRPATSGPAKATSSRPSCPNKNCPRPDVVEGICRSCGRVVDDSNIVSEVTFGETSSGAATVQGSFLSADQGGMRSLGANFRRVGGGGSDEREKSIRDAKMLISGFAAQLKLSDGLVNTAVQAFKLASNANFIQGRSLPGVAAVCLYVACRNEPPCKIMLLDLADLVHINVFKLGRTFKAFNKAIPICNGGLEPVYPEDLIYRFASKLEFQGQTMKVAEDAARLVKRMSRDWMVMGRRPSGICGACLLMAARMNNFRRTVREVVYIVKVTNHTIQSRLEEFKVTESSNMTVEDFLSQDLLESSHDPPSFYKQSAEYQAKMKSKSRKRKRPVETLEEIEEEPRSSATEVNGDHPVDPALDGLVPRVLEEGEMSSSPVGPAPLADMGLMDPDSSVALTSLIRNFGDGGVPEEPVVPVVASGDPDDVDNEAVVEAQMTNAEGEDSKTGKKITMPIDDDWENEEEDLMAEISEMVNDPHTQEHADRFSEAQKRALEHTRHALSLQPSKNVSMAAQVLEDEFADDPEVLNCLLSEEEASLKEQIWSNMNKDWLRAQQEKVFRLKMERDRPKQTRRRKKRPRIGEGQMEPAGSAADAAVSVMKERAISKRINYDAIRSLFDIGEGDEGQDDEEEEEVQEDENEFEAPGSPEYAEGDGEGDYDDQEEEYHDEYE